MRFYYVHEGVSKSRGSMVNVVSKNGRPVSRRETVINGYKVYFLIEPDLFVDRLIGGWE